MTETEPLDVHGPIDYILLEFRGDNLTGKAADALMDLVTNGVIRIFDLLVIRKDEDGTFSGLDVSDMSADSFGGFSVFAGVRSGILGEADVEEAANALEAGTMAALIVYENTWAIPFVAAAREVGAQVVASARIPADVVMAALDSLESADAAAETTA
jgi:hypothetical protein